MSQKRCRRGENDESFPKEPAIWNPPSPQDHYYWCFRNHAKCGPFPIKLYYYNPNERSQQSTTAAVAPKSTWSESHSPPLQILFIHDGVCEEVEIICHSSSLNGANSGKSSVNCIRGKTGCTDALFMWFLEFFAGYHDGTWWFCNEVCWEWTQKDIFDGGTASRTQNNQCRINMINLHKTVNKGTDDDSWAPSTISVIMCLGVFAATISM